MLNLAHQLYDLYENPILSREELTDGLWYLGAQALSPFRAAGAAAARSILYLKVELSSALYGPSAQMASSAITSTRVTAGATSSADIAVEMVEAAPAAPPAESEEATPDAPYRDPVACREMVGSDSVLRLTGEMATEYAARQAARRDEAAARGRLRQEHGPADSTSIV